MCIRPVTSDSHLLLTAIFRHFWRFIDHLGLVGLISQTGLPSPGPRRRSPSPCGGTRSGRSTCGTSTSSSGGCPPTSARRRTPRPWRARAGGGSRASARCVPRLITGSALTLLELWTGSTQPLVTRVCHTRHAQHATRGWPLAPHPHPRRIGLRPACPPSPSTPPRPPSRPLHRWTTSASPTPPSPTLWAGRRFSRGGTPPEREWVQPASSRFLTLDSSSPSIDEF